LLRSSYRDIGLQEPVTGRPLDHSGPIEFGSRNPLRNYTRNQRLDEQRNAYKRVRDSVDAIRRMLERQVDRREADKENRTPIGALVRQQCDLLAKRAEHTWQRVEQSRKLFADASTLRDTLERDMPDNITAELVAARGKLDALRHLHEHFFDRPTELRAQARRIVQDEQAAVRQIRAECTAANRRFSKSVTRAVRLELELLELYEELYISRVQEHEVVAEEPPDHQQQQQQQQDTDEDVPLALRLPR
jgi:ribonuclease HI